MSKITDTVWALAEPLARELSLQLWDVEFVKEAGTNYLRVYIDRPGEGVFISDCEAMSKALDPVLDEEDPVPVSYVFEVSSAGAERPLKRPEHFAAFLGSKVEVRLYKPQAGKKSLQGILSAYEDGAVTLEIGEETVKLEKNEVAGVRLTLD